MTQRFAWTNPLVNRVLYESGWTEERIVPISAWVATLEAEGYTVFPVAKDILSSFGGMTVVPPAMPQAAFRSGAMVFDPIWAATGERPRLVEREKVLGCRLVPLGEWSGEYIVVVAEDGRVYAETTFQLLPLGASFTEAVETIITGTPALHDVTGPPPK